MSRWLSRLRRSAAVLLGVHLLQATLVVASSVCEPAAAAAVTAFATDAVTPHDLAAGVAAHHEMAHHEMAHHEMAHHEMAHHASHVAASSPADERGPASSVPSHDHGPAGATCPMAMTCTVVAVASTAPVITTRVVAVPDAPAGHAGLAPRSLRLAPEPPPPRG
jgi:uncharacterized protein involved in copper resistance